MTIESCIVQYNRCSLYGVLSPCADISATHEYLPCHAASHSPVYGGPVYQFPSEPILCCHPLHRLISGMSQIFGKVWAWNKQVDTKLCKSHGQIKHIGNYAWAETWLVPPHSFFSTGTTTPPTKPNKHKQKTSRILNKKKKTVNKHECNMLIIKLSIIQ